VVAQFDTPITHMLRLLPYPQIFNFHETH
jgi:hypothetical protein